MGGSCGVGGTILILAGPQHAEIPQEERVLNNIEVVMDISGSMSAPYGDGTRSTEALQAINDFTTFRKDDAFGSPSSATKSSTGCR
ncbi:MAG: VWA domain-containing protein [Verrucomicrobiales bacterium]